MAKAVAVGKRLGPELFLGQGRGLLAHARQIGGVSIGKHGG